MDHSEHPHAHKQEPSLASDAVAQPVIEAGEMPAWLANQPAPTTAQRWGRRLAFMGVAIVTIAFTAGATMLGLEMYESNRSMQVVSANAKAPVPATKVPGPAAETLPFVEKHTPSLPPLVMLPTDPSAAKKDAAAATAPAVVAETPAVHAEEKAPVAPPVVRKEEKAAAAPAPAVVKAPEKAAPVAPAVVPHKAEKPAPAVVVAKKEAVKPVKKAPLAPAAAAKKAAVLAKRIANPTPERAHTRAKPIKGTMLQPPRDRGLDPAFQEAPRQAVDRRCHPGELARECEARTR